MAIQKINLGTEPLGEGGDTYRSANTKINENFSNTAHAASRLVGTATGNVMEVGAFGIGGTRETFPATTLASAKEGFIRIQGDHGGVIPASGYGYQGFNMKDSGGGTVLLTPSTAGGSALSKSMGYRFITYTYSSNVYTSAIIYTTDNTDEHGTNGYLKPSSPILKIEQDHMWSNDDGEAMGATYTKRGVGDYEISNTTGLRSEGWYIEIPNDLHGNPHVAVTIEDDEGTIRLKCFKRVFNMDTFKFEPDLKSPLDIPEGRWIDLRFNDLPVEELQEPEPEEGPLVGEEVEPEVVEEPSEESK